MYRVWAALLLLTLGAAPNPVAGRVIAVRIDRVEPFADGMPFGQTGAYERVIGVARGELDPADKRNAIIAGIDRAQRNAAGMVEYETDLFILRPADPRRGNHHLLFDVVNRGNKVATNRLNRTLPKDNSNDPRTAANAGDGFLFRRGYTVAWAGWDPDSPKTNSGMTIRIPALPAETKEIRDEFVSGTRGAPMTQFRLSYNVNSPDQAKARLTMRAREADPPEDVPAAGWRFGGERTVQLLPEGSKPLPGAIYSFTYTARSPWVSGIGFAAQRDVVAYLKSNPAGTPAAGPIGGAIGFGVSQSGRFLRDFVKYGFNQDESGHKVFDGVLSHIAGIGGVFLNAPFAEPFRTRTQHEDHAMPENAFPFSAARTRDPVSGKDTSLLRHDRFDPLLIETNTDAEYWQKGASLLGTDPVGRTDVPIPGTTRLFLIAGSQHTGRHGATDAPGPCVNLRNPHDPYPALRALLVALDDWIKTGRAAPASRIPRIDDKTLVAAPALYFPRLPGGASNSASQSFFAVPAAADAIDPVADWVHPKSQRSPYAALVPAVDIDGNDLAGLKLPDIAVPLGTYTGFNQYAPPFPTGEMCDRDGSSLPFAATDGQKGRDDPRRSITARYGSKANYVALVRRSADRLVADRLLLREDADRYVASAEAVPRF